MRRRFSISSLFLAAAVILAGIGAILDAAHPGSALDIHFHDTYFVIAHVHVSIALAALLLLFGAIYYLVPKIFGRRMSYRAGLAHFIITFAALLLVMLHIHFPESNVISGPRRYYNFSARSSLTGFMAANSVITMIAFALLIAQIMFILNMVYSTFPGRKEP